MDSNSIENMPAISEMTELCNFIGKKKRNTNRGRANHLLQVENPDNGLDSNSTSADVVSNTPPDYTYDQLLSFIYQQHRTNSSPSPQEAKFKLKSPLIQAVGQLGTTGSTIPSNNGGQLLINKALTLDKMEKLLVRYTREFVLCPACKSADTTLEKQQTRQGFKVCSTCHVRTPVNLDQDYNKLRW